MNSLILLALSLNTIYVHKLMKLVNLLMTVLLLIAVTPSVFACSTCMVGDPTQSLMGAEKPFRNRLRVSTDFMMRSEELGRDGFNKKVIDEIRQSFNIAYAPSSRWMLGANVPYINRQLESFNLAQQEITAPGDITFTFKHFMQQSEFMQKHMYGFLGGVKLSTAAEQKDSNGIALDFDVQVGQGADVANLGAWYAHFNFPFLYYGSASYHVASTGFQEFQAGNALVFNATAQYATSYGMAYYAGMEGRSSKRDIFSGVTDDDSGGNIVFITPGLVYTIQPELILNVVLKLPLVERLNGEHEESTIFSIGVTYDFEIH